jgi:adenylosuccinate lyase
MANKYESPLTQRYVKNSPLLTVFSEKAKVQQNNSLRDKDSAFQIESWRQLWIWLAEAEKELGLTQITDEMINELQANKTNIDWTFADAEEKRLKHDVMAHNHTYGKVCPKAAGIIHLGATSCYVQDNADLIRQRDALDYILKRYAIVMDRLAKFSEKHAKTVTVGRTHWQTASLVTVGKRGVLWLQELALVFEKVRTSRR